STSRLRILSAPATARAATWWRNVSLARLTSCWISALAAATIRSPSALALDFASSISCAERFSACATISPAWSRACCRTSAERLAASSRSCLPRSAAANPSAICFWRSCIARCSGGQIYLIVSQMKMPNQIAWPSNVALIFTLASPANETKRRSTAQRLLHDRHERIREQQVQTDTHADHGDRIEQAGDDEHLHLQRRNHLGLTRRTFQEAAAENSETDGRTERAETDQQRDRDSRHTENRCDFHFPLLSAKRVTEK